MTGPRTLFERLAATARRFPGRTALEANGEALSYAHLVSRAGTLATELHGMAAPRPLRRIGIMADRSVAAYSGYLAALRLGAAAVPLGADLPAERLEMITRLADLDVVLGDAPSGLPVPAVPLDAAGAAGARAAPGRAANSPAVPLARPGDIAYILFTSGSTGTPKGVPILHRNVSALLDHLIPRYDIGPGCRISAASDLTFDPSVTDMFSAWDSGATLVVPARNDLVRPARFIARERITHWTSVPSLIDYADRLHDLSPGGLPGLRWSGFGGEPLTLAQARLWQAAAPQSVLQNHYGPTELTITCAVYRLPRDQGRWPDTANGTVPIGTPVPGMQILLLDGELCMRGPQRFPGYLRPADNAGRFIRADGTGDATPERPGPDLFYRTGDLVRPLSEGDPDLVHAGRLDHQVKISGHRIELAEVEAALRALPGITQAVVMARPGAFRELGLEAYYTGQPQDPVALRTALSALPRHMVPRGFTCLDSLPLGPNGKIDRLALAADTHPLHGR
jgi:amino acid adenylation domain-containing protein